MRKKRCIFFSSIFLVLACSITAFALGETGKTLTYKVTHNTAAGKLTTYAHYSIVAHAEAGYWLQRTTSMRPDSKPLSITQTLLDDYTHEPLRYIMHRPAKMDRPPSVIDLPLSEMGKDEILPTPLIGAFTEDAHLQLEAGSFDTKKGWDGHATLWVSLDIPVLGVAQAETQDWTMELVRIKDGAVDLLSQKPSEGGVVYLKD